MENSKHFSFFLHDKSSKRKRIWNGLCWGAFDWNDLIKRSDENKEFLQFIAMNGINNLISWTLSPLVMVLARTVNRGRLSAISYPIVSTLKLLMGFNESYNFSTIFFHCNGQRLSECVIEWSTHAILPETRLWPLVMQTQMSHIRALLLPVSSGWSFSLTEKEMLHLGLLHTRMHARTEIPILKSLRKRTKRQRNRRKEVFKQMIDILRKFM